MDPWMYALPLVVVFGFLLIQKVRQVGVAEAHSLVKGGARLVDVRSPMDFHAGHLRGAVNVPAAEVGSKLRVFGDKHKPIVVYGAWGASSGATAKLRRAGFSQVYDLGGMGRWGAES